MNPIICITGADGTGKSTLIDELCNINKYYVQCTIWDLLASSTGELPFDSKQGIDDYLCKLTPDSRTLFLAHALKYPIDKALDRNKPIIINSYYYKYFVSELALGASRQLIESLIPLFPEPDVVICLETSIEGAATRKQRFSRYECGLVSKPDKEAFVEFQHKVNEHWSSFKNDSWHVIDTTFNIDETLLKAKQILQWK